MPVNINSFKLYVEFVANKAQAGNSVSVSQFNDVSDRAQMQLYEKDYQTFLKTEQVSDFLQTFLVSKITGSVSVDGTYQVPANLQHVCAIRKYYVRENGKGFNVKVDEIKQVAWTDVQSPGLREASLRFPKYEEFGAVLKFMPRNIGIIEIDYFRLPVKPVWNFTVISGRPVYFAGTSVNFEWSEYSMNQVAANYLALIGVNLKDRELAQFSELYKQQTNSIL